MKRYHIIQDAAQYLRKDTFQCVTTKPKLIWQIILEEFSWNERQPQSVLYFLSCLLMNKDHPNREPVNRLIRSYAADLVHGVTRGRFIASKHSLLAPGLHNMAGQMKPVEVASHLDHCIDYRFCLEKVAEVFNVWNAIF